MKTPEEICPDFTDWPQRWTGTDDDLPCGRALVDLMRPFVAHLISRDLSKKTIRGHMDNLWLLGGEIIRDVNDAEEDDSLAPLARLTDAVGPDGGPYCRHLHSESELRSFDATCRKLAKFLDRKA